MKAIAQTGSRQRRRTQAQRSSDMRQRLIQATIACLAQDGYAGATISRITARAKVSHGASGHHFASKTALIKAAAETIIDSGRLVLHEVLERQGCGPGNIGAAAQEVWQRLHSTRLMRAFLELSIAAQHDRELAGILKRLAAASWNDVRQATAPDPGDGQVQDELVLVALTRSFLLGLALQYHGWGETRTIRPQLEAWGQVLSGSLQARTDTTGSTA
jgi:AcrR family transcriptional regulator